MTPGLRRSLAGLAATAAVMLTAACWPFDGEPSAAPTPTSPVAIPAESPATPPADSPPAPKPTANDLSGTWSGTWANQTPDDSTGSFTLTWTQTGSQLSGSITITGTPCLTGGAITGSTDGQTISFGAVSGEVTVAYDGTVAGSTMSGSYGTECGDARGTWSAART